MNQIQSQHFFLVRVPLHQSTYTPHLTNQSNRFIPMTSTIGHNLPPYMTHGSVISYHIVRHMELVSHHELPPQGSKSPWHVTQSPLNTWTPHVDWRGVHIIIENLACPSMWWHLSIMHWLGDIIILYSKFTREGQNLSREHFPIGVPEPPSHRASQKSV